MILLVSYFEIDGQIVACDTIEDPLQVDISQSALDASFRLHEREMIAYELTGDPNTLHVKDADFAEVASGTEEYWHPSDLSRQQRKNLGKTIMRWSVGGALVPDPIPLVDEIAFAATFAIGAYLYTSNY